MAISGHVLDRNPILEIKFLFQTKAITFGEFVTNEIDTSCIDDTTSEKITKNWKKKNHQVQTVDCFSK